MNIESIDPKFETDIDVKLCIGINVLGFDKMMDINVAEGYLWPFAYIEHLVSLLLKNNTIKPIARY